MKQLFENWRKHTIEEKAELKIPVEKYEAALGAINSLLRSL